MVSNVFAMGSDTVLWGGDANAIQDHTGLGNNNPKMIASNIINIVLGFLGILSLILIMFGGFKWMTAGGDDTKIDEAKKVITSGIIGLAIIIVSYAIAYFVLISIRNATGS